MQYIKIPEERIGVLIGGKGEVKEHILNSTKIKLAVDSDSGDVTLDDKDCDDPLAPVKVASVVRAIGRGFSPEKAFKLLHDDFYFETMDIRDYVGKKQEHVRRMRGRLIGTNGKTRRIIEELSSTDISIFGNTVSIIGEVVELGIARTALDMLLNGSEHATVYRFLERKRRELRMAELGLEIIRDSRGKKGSAVGFEDEWGFGDDDDGADGLKAVGEDKNPFLEDEEGSEDIKGPSEDDDKDG